MKRSLPFVAAAVFAACTNSASVPAKAPSAKVDAEETGSTVVARVGGQDITLAEVDGPILADIRGKQQEIYELRSASLRNVIRERLLEREAARRGVEPRQLFEEEVVSKVGQPSDEEVRAFYDQRKDQPGIPPFEEAAPFIRHVLTRQKTEEATEAFFVQLEKGAGVEIFLEPVRVQVEAVGPSKGPESAPVTIVAFSDFECPYCYRVNATLDQILQTYEGKVRLVFRDFPLNFHPNAQKAAEAGHCAHEQGKFWEMHDKMFANQRQLDVASLKGYAKEIGLDEKAFAECLDNGKKAAVVQENLFAGQQLGVRGTPAFFVNGRMVSGAQPFSEFARIIDEELGRSAKASP